MGAATSEQQLVCRDAEDVRQLCKAARAVARILACLALLNGALWAESPRLCSVRGRRHFGRTETPGRNLRLVIAWNQGARIERSRIRGEFNDLPLGNVCDRYCCTADDGAGGVAYRAYNAAGAYGGL